MLAALAAQVAARLAAQGSGLGQSNAATEAEGIVDKLARRGQLHTRRNARSTRYRLERIDPENHKKWS
ncbi:hypothetical protein GCM10027594_17520 [Hymenobacter agri]